MTVFYLLFSFSDLILLYIGNVVDAHNENTFLCVTTWYMISVTKAGSVFLLFHNLFLYLFSILIWYIFYRIPQKYGLLGHSSAKDLVMDSRVSKRSLASTTQSEQPPR